MKRSLSSANRWSIAAALVLFGGLIHSRADVDASRYGSIVERNPFQLRPPPPPQAEVSQQPVVAVPPATVELTGITSILSSKRALLEIIPGPGKQLIKPVLAEGEKVESIEVVSIDVEKNQVIIRNNGFITNLTFKVVKSTPSTPQPGAQGQPQSASIVAPKPVVNPTQASLNYNQPSSAGRSGVIMTGGNPGYQEPAATVPAASLGTGLSTMQQNNANNPNNGGFRSIPSRTIRSGGLAPQTTTGQPDHAPAIDPAQAYLNMKAQQEWAKQRGIVMPPPPTIPGVE
jgi:hypothetical protein